MLKHDEYRRKNRFLWELTLNLQHKGLTVKQEAEDDRLTVELDGRRLCSVTHTGAIRYWKEDVEGNIRNAALDRVTDITRTTAEYINRIEAAPQLGIGPKGDYRPLADFNDVILAGHPTRYSEFSDIQREKPVFAMLSAILYKFQRNWKNQ